MNKENLLPPSLAVENKVGLLPSIFFVSALFLLLFLPVLSGPHELFSSEGVFAAASSEYIESAWDVNNGFVVRAHHEPLRDIWPLYPFTVSLLLRAGIPMETSLRVISTVMLGILSLISGLSAGLRCGKRGGIVAACCCFGTLFVLDKGFIGGPESMAACFLLSGQLLFFHYGSRYADWNTAWIASACFISLAFLTIGPSAILFFVFPLFFLRRPLSFSGKFRTRGFFAGIVLLTAVILSWALPLGGAFRQYVGDSRLMIVPFGEYLKDVLMFPLLLPFRFLPWSGVMWLPFCVALQAISPHPVFSRYLRTLCFSMFALVWLLPGSSISFIFFLLGPLSILTGLNYELGIRRYTRTFRRMLIAGSCFFPMAVMFMLAVQFLPERWLFLLGDEEKMLFRNIPEYLWLSLGAMIVLFVLNLIYIRGSRNYPVWIQFLLLGLGIGIINISVLQPYRLMEHTWRDLGSDIRSVLPSDVKKLYKYEIKGMYCGLFYAGVPVYKLHDFKELETLEDTIYLISPVLPIYPDRVWTGLFPEHYEFQGVPISVWRGVRRRNSAELDEMDEYGSL